MIISRTENTSRRGWDCWEWDSGFQVQPIIIGISVLVSRYLSTCPVGSKGFHFGLMRTARAGPHSSEPALGRRPTTGREHSQRGATANASRRPPACRRHRVHPAISWGRIGPARIGCAQSASGRLRRRSGGRGAFGRWALRSEGRSAGVDGKGKTFTF